MIIGDPSRADVEGVMSRPEFQYPKSLFERIGDWIADRFGNLFDRLPGGGPTGSFGGGVGSLVGWLIVVLAIAAVVAVIVIAVRHWVPRIEETGEKLSEIETEHRRRAREWAAEADELEARGEWKLAIRARFRELVRTLVDRSQVADLAGRTTRELLEDVTVTTPGAADAFDTACVLFELPWYGDVPTGPQENQRFRSLAAQVLAAQQESDLHDGETPRVGRVEVHAAGGR